MISSKFLFLCTVLILAVIIAPLFSQSPSQLFQQGLLKENGEGDLKAAVAIYEKIVGDETADRTLRAKAQLHIGDCYEKLGLKEAQKAYQQVIDSYPEQMEAVKLANEKLSLLLRAKAVAGTGNKEFSIRRVKEGTDVGFEGAVSPDGRYLSYVDWESGDLAVYEIATGNKHRLTNKGSWDKLNEFAYYSRWSPDGKQIVYDWYNTKEDLMELRIIGFDGSKPRILYSNKEGERSTTYGWSPDSKQILAVLFKENGEVQFVLVSSEDGSVRVLKTLEQDFEDQNMNFSPDGSYIVYDFQQKEDSPERDISILSTDGSREISLVEHPANDYVLGWAPDGKNILFASDRRNSLDVWVIQFSDGKVQGTPKLVTPNIGKICYPKGFTRNGSFYYEIYDDAMDIYFGELSPETGKIIGLPKKLITRFEGFLTQPEYSPDGKYIAYINVVPVSLWTSHTSISIQSLETGKIQEFSSKHLRNISCPRWSPDGRSVIVLGWDWKAKRGLYRIDTQSGISTLLVPISKSVNENWLGQHEWSRDGKAIFLERLPSNMMTQSIMLIELESGTEKELYHGESNSRGLKFSCSPDGKWLAFLSMGVKEYVLRIMPADGGEYRELYRFKPEHNQISNQKLIWTPDGKYILFERFQLAEKKFSLWRIPKEGGEPQELGLKSDSYIVASIHPDGRHIVFASPASTGENSGNWVMENFLPVTETKK